MIEMKSNRTISRRRLHWVGVAVVAMAGLMQIVLPTSAGASLPQLISGSYEGNPWAFGAEQRSNLRCVEGLSTENNLESCQMVSHGLWSNGATLQIVAHSAALFFFLSPKVGYLNVDVRPAGHAGNRWLRVRARRITDAQLKETHLSANLRYGVAAASQIATSKGDVCIKRIAVFDNAGKRIERSPPIVCAKSKSAKEMAESANVRH
jgi:hypothetical protein